MNFSRLTMRAVSGLARTALIFSALVHRTQAADIVKTNNADALNLASSWTGLAVPGTSDRAIYRQSTTAYANDLGTNLSWKGIVLTNNAKAWTINGTNTLTLAGTNGIDMNFSGANFIINANVALATNQTWAVTNGRTLTVAGVISGGANAAITKTGTGTLTLTNMDNAFAGGIIVAAGALSTDGNSDTLGTGAVTLKDGTSLSLAAGSIGNAIVIASGQNASMGGNGTLRGPITGSGSLTHGSSGAFALTLAADNSGFSGNITNTSVISVTHKNALGTGTLYLQDSAGTNSSFSAQVDLIGYNAITNKIVLLNNAKLGSTSRTGDFELKGVVSGTGGFIVNHSLIKVILSAANTYTNTTAVSNGVLVVNGTQASRLTIVASGATLTGTGVVQTVTANAGSILSVGDGKQGVLIFRGNLTLAANSTNLMKIFATNSFDLLKGSATNTLTAGGVILLDFTSDLTVKAGDQFNVFQLFTNWSSVIKGTGLSLATIGLPGSLTAEAPGFATNGLLTIVANTNAAPIVLPDKFPISMTYHGPTAGTNGIMDELLKYEPVDIIGGVASGVWDTVRSNFPNKILLDQDAWGGTVSIGMQSAWPGHWLLKVGTKLSANCSPTDTVLHVQDYAKLATSQASVDNGTNNNASYLLIYGLDGSGKPDWSRAEHLRIRGVDTVNGTVTVDRAQQGSSPLSFTNGQAVVARHMMFWANNPGGQWQLNFSLQCQRGGPLNLTAAEWFAREIKKVVDKLGADGVEFDVARWQWGSLSSNTMDCDNNLVPDYGYIDGVCSFGLGGQVFARDLRKLLGPGKIIQMDSDDGVGQQRGWQYVNGCQMESFPDANDYSQFSEAFLHLRQYRDNITSLPNFSYAYVKTTTTTFEHMVDTDGSDLDWHFRVGFAAGLLAGMPSPFTSIADPNFNPAEEVPGATNVPSANISSIFYWDEYMGGTNDLNNWQWLGQPLGPAMQDLGGLASSNLLNQAAWAWKIETNFAASCGLTNGEFSANITTLAAVTNILPVNNGVYFTNSLAPKILSFGVRLELTNGFPAIINSQEYTLEFEARGNDHWDYAGQSFDKVPRALNIQSPQVESRLTVMLNSNWGFYRLSFQATTNNPQICFGVSEQIGDVSIRNLRLYAGGGERWSREFTNGIVLLNMSKQPWSFTTPAAYRHFLGTQNPQINNGRRVSPSITVPSWDAVFLVRTSGTNIIVPEGVTYDFSAGGLLLYSNDTLSGCGGVLGDVTVSGGAGIYAGTNNLFGGTLSLSNNLTLNRQTLEFNLEGYPTNRNDQIAVAGNVTNLGNTFISLNYISGFLGAGTYTLMTYASRQGGTFVLDTNYPNVILNNGATNLTLTVGSGGAQGEPYVWRGNYSSNEWDIGMTANWKFNGGEEPYVNGAGVLFDDTASAYTVNLNTTVSPGGMTVDGTSNYTITGSGGIAGVCHLLITNTGTLTLATTNSYSGGTTVAAGTLAGTTASLQGNITNNAALLFNQTSDGIFSNRIAGSGTLTKGGAGVLILTATNTFTGDIMLMSGSGNTISVAADANLGAGTNIIINQNAGLKITGTFATARTFDFEGSNPFINVTNACALTLSGWLHGGSQTIRKTGAGALTLAASNSFASGSTFLVADGALNLKHAAALNGTSLKFNPAGSFLDNVSGAPMLAQGLNGLDLTTGFTFTGTDDLDLSIAPGSFVQTTNSTRTISVTAKTLKLSGFLSTGTNHANSACVEGGLTKSGNGTLILSGISDYTSNTTVNAGVLLVNGSLGNSAVSVKTNATLGGSGLLKGPLAVNPGGILQPGAGGTNIATLTVSNSANLSGTTLLLLNRTNGQTASKLAVSATLNLGGTLTVTNTGPALQAGDTFVLFEAASFTNGFSTTNLPALDPGLNWNTDQLAASGMISVVTPATNPPVFIAPLMFTLGDKLVLGGSNGTAGNQYYVLSTTNLKLPTASWTVMATNYFSPGGLFNFTNPIIPGEPDRFFILLVP